MDGYTPLEVEIRRRIVAAGPMPVAEYMRICLTDEQHGYYVTRDPFGQQGDFITAPEVSQMFGELIGIWMAAVWKQMGAPENVRVIELGPGRGTLMNDALRAVKVMPKFHDAIVVHLVEISPPLQAAQEQTLQGASTQVFWHSTLADIPPGPAIIVANEFFDALPVNQAVKLAGRWYERHVGVGREGRLDFVAAPNPLLQIDTILPEGARNAPDGSVFEWRNDTAAMELGRRVMSSEGAALVIDYGHEKSDIGETFQAVGRHAFADPLSEPGNIDLTAHVDFQALAKSVEAMGATTHGPVEQATFLHRLGIDKRAAALKARAQDVGTRAEIDVALARLTDIGRTGMGSLFKAIAFAHPKLGRLPGFD